MSYLNNIIAKYKNKGIVVDTNLLLLYFVGTYNENEIEIFKKTLTYTKEDFYYLVRFLKNFRVYITPNILTELTNITDSLNSKTKGQFFKHVKYITSSTIESYIESVKAMSNDSFLFLGLADSTLEQLSFQDFLILTDDFPLYQYLFQNGRYAINFNHIRTEYMIK